MSPRIITLGAHILDVLGRPVESIPAGQGSARLEEIKATGRLVRKPGGQTSATILPIRPNGERPALHVPGATSLLERADIDLARVAGVGADALMIGAPDRLGRFVDDGLPEVITAADGALVAVDVLGPGSPPAFDRLKGLLGGRTGSCRTATSCSDARGSLTIFRPSKRF